MLNGTHRQARGNDINPRQSGSRKAWGRTWALGSLLALCSLAAQAQTMSVNSINRTGCADGGFAFNVTYAGLAAPTGPWKFHTVVQQGATVYMDQLFGPVNLADGTGSWGVTSSSPSGAPTAPFPMPDNTPFTMTISVLNAANQTVSTTQATANRCGTGAQIMLPTPTAVPTLEAGGLAALAGALGVVGWLRRRRMA
jgi:hypothetical protein